jgi:serine/threonine-protein kinase
MSADSRIDDLLDEVLESARPIEEVCAQFPELVGEVRQRLARLRAVSAQVDSLFPLTAEWDKPSDGPGAARAGAELASVSGYEISAILGRGGMGIVYRARHLKLNRTVALKMLLAGSHASQQEHARFVREAEAVAALRHPNFVQIFDVGEVDGTPYFTMECIDGGSLADRLAGGGQSVRESADMLATLARAVFAAHQSGIIHRDLKPANILLTDDGAPKISDFGLARRLGADVGLTHTGDRLGTPSYMAPEQMTGSTASIGPSVDVFALGAMFYEMLTGSPPFRGTSLSDTERRLTSEEPTPPSRLNAKVPRDLETICLKCLEKTPKNRYASAGELAADLERFLRHEPIHARPVVPAERVLRWIRRNPLPTALAVTAALLLAVIVGDAIRESALAADRRAEKARLTARFESGVQLVQSGRFAEARAILGKLGDGGFEDLRQRIDRTLSELALVEELDAVGVKRSMVLNAPRSRSAFNAEAARAYASIFDRSRIATPTEQPGVVAPRIRNSDISESLVASLDDWAFCEPDRATRDWLLEVARQADPDPAGWRDKARYPNTWNDREALAQLAATAAPAKQSMQLLRVLADRLASAGLDATAFCQRLQLEHPDNFLANLSLANALRTDAPAESMRFYQAALAIRPGSATAHNNLGVALTALGRSDEALTLYEQALQLDQISAQIPYNLGLALVKAMRPDEANAQFRRAIQLAPTLVDASEALATTLLEQQHFAEAEAVLTTCLNQLADDSPERPRLVELLERCQAAQSRAVEQPR